MIELLAILCVAAALPAVVVAMGALCYYLATGTQLITEAVTRAKS